MKISESKAAELTGLSRITIQRFRSEYYKSKTNESILCPKKEGYFYFYDEKDMEILWIIKMLKSLGKSNDEIVNELSNPNWNKKAVLENTISELTKLVNIAKSYLDTGFGYEILDAICYENYPNYNEINQILNCISKVASYKMETVMDEISIEELSGGLELISDLFDNMCSFSFSDIDPSDDMVQCYLDEFRKNYFDNKFYSKSLMRLIGLMLKKGYEMDVETDPDFETTIDFLKKSIDVYTSNYFISQDLIDIDDLLDKNQFEILAYSKKSANSVEIQKEIENIAMYYYYMCFKDWNFTLELINRISDWFDKKEIRKKFDHGFEKGIFHFTSVALKYFSESKREKLNYSI